MKCPFCNFLNSNTRNYCLRCNADLTELKIEFGLSGNPTEDAGEKEEVKQNIDLPKIPVPKVILKSSSQKQIASLQSRIANLQKGHSFEATPVGSSQTQTLVPIEISEFEDNSVESSMTKDEVSELIAESQSTVTTDNHDDEFQLRFMNISYDLEKRMERWRIILNPKIRSSYDDLINSFPDHSDEFEIGPQSQLSEKKKLNIEQLYDLQLKEITENRNSIKDYQKSHTRSLDRNLLNQKYKELKTDLLATEDESLEKDFKEESNNLPIPESRTIIFAAFIDLVVTLISTLAFVGLLPIVKNKNYNPNHIFDLLKANVLSTPTLSLAVTAIATWFVLRFVFIIFNQGSIGQAILGLKICTLNGDVPSFSNLLKRFFAQFFNILTLGILLIIQLKSQNGLTCKFSKTRLTFSAFIN